MSSSSPDRSPRPESDPTLDDALGQAYFRDRNVAEVGRGPGDKEKTIFRKLAQYVVPVLLFLIAVDVMAKKLFPPEDLIPYVQSEKAYYTLKVDYFQSRPAPDVLFLGSSRMRNALIPKRFATPLSKLWGRPAQVYNLGLVNTKSEEYLAIITSHLPDPPPKYVVIGFSGNEVVRVDNFQYASRFLWKLPNFFSYLNRSTFESFQVKNLEYFIESTLCRCWYVFGYRNAFAKMVHEETMRFLGLDRSPAALKLLEGSRKNLIAQVLSEDGYTIHPSTLSLDQRLKTEPDKFYIPKTAMTLNRNIFDSASVDMLRAIVEKLRALGIKVALVETPASPYLQEKSPVLHGNPFRFWMRGVAEELDVDFIPFQPEKTGLTNSFYMDLNHMTDQGAALYSQLLFQKLKNRKFFSEEGV